MKLLVRFLGVIVPLLSIQWGTVNAAAVCDITDTIRCDFETNIYVLVNDEGIIVYQSNPVTQVDTEITSVTFEEVVEITSNIDRDVNRLVRQGQIDETFSFKDIREKAERLGGYGSLTERILENGNIILASSDDKKANIYLLGNLLAGTPEFQVNIGPNENGTVEVLTLALFFRPVFWDSFEFNIYSIDFTETEQ